MIIGKMLTILGLIFALLPAANSQIRNPIYDYSELSQLKKDELLFVVEIPQGSSYKLELRTPTGSIINDRRLCPRKVIGKDKYVYSYPAHYGITVARFAEDGDPLDMVVFGENEKYWRQVSFNTPEPEIVRVIGMIKMEECDAPPCKEKEWERDWKVLAVDDQDYLFKHVQSPKDLPKEIKDDLKDFFANYKGTKNGHSKTRMVGFLGKTETLKLINDKHPIASSEQRIEEVKQCNNLYQTIANQKNDQKPKYNKSYINCVERVHNKSFFPGSPQFQFFLRYTAYQYLLKLGEKGVTLENAISKMEVRKRERKKHYRFVGRDMTAPPGTGARIYEWVKTSNRNQGCPKDFPEQHYDLLPLINL